MLNIVVETNPFLCKYSKEMLGLQLRSRLISEDSRQEKFSTFFSVQ